MKTILFTGHDEAYRPLGDLTVPRMRGYSERHGIYFRCYEVPPSDLNIYWTGVARGLELLREGYDRVVYLDVDQMITNPNYARFLGMTGGFHASKDWGKDATEPHHFSMCGFVAHRDCIPLFEHVLSMEPEWRDKPFPEQGPMQHAVKELSGEPLVVIHPRREFNSVPDEVCPGQVPEAWEIGDFAAHLTMLPIDQRIELYLKILRKLC